MKKTKLFVLIVCISIVCISLLFALALNDDDSCSHRDADGDSLCDNCGESYGEDHKHDYTVKNTDSKYLATAADCNNSATYFYSCSCGDMGTETFTSGTKTDHIPKDAVEENIVEATCTEDGHCDSVVYCEKCNAEISRTRKEIISAFPHKMENGKCSFCNLPNSSEGLEFSLNPDGKSYTVTGIGTCTSVDVVVGVYNNLSVTNIGDEVFYGCTSLESVTIGNSVTIIGVRAFKECTSLENITIPNGVTSIGEQAFCNCTSLASITIPDGVTSIGEGTFWNCDGLKSITIPDSVTSIGIFAFDSCSNLESVTFGNNVTSIGDDAFMYCGSLKSVTIPDSVTSIGVYAFHSCTSLESITIPDSVTSIGERAFYNCTSLKYNEYDNAYYLGNSNNPYFVLAKPKTKSVNSVAINNNTKIIYNGAFYGYTNLESVTIPDSVISLSERTFQGCTNLKSVTIGNGVTSIGESAFQNCSGLTSVTVGNGVTSICISAFENCRSLTIIKYCGTTGQWNAISKGGRWDEGSGRYFIIYGYTGE